MPEENEEVSQLAHISKWDAIHQIFYEGQNYYRVVDVIDALEVAHDPANY